MRWKCATSTNNPTVSSIYSGREKNHFEYSRNAMCFSLCLLAANRICCRWINSHLGYWLKKNSLNKWICSLLRWKKRCQIKRNKWKPLQKIVSNWRASHHPVPFFHPLKRWTSQHFHKYESLVMRQSCCYGIILVCVRFLNFGLYCFRSMEWNRCEMNGMAFFSIFLISLKATFIEKSSLSLR